MGRPDFGQPTAHPTPPVANALHDDDADVVVGDIAKVVHDSLPTQPMIKPEPTLPLGCRRRVPLTQVHNPSSILLLYREQLDA